LSLHSVNVSCDRPFVGPETTEAGVQLPRKALDPRTLGDDLLDWTLRVVELLGLHTDWSPVVGFVISDDEGRLRDVLGGEPVIWIPNSSIAENPRAAGLAIQGALRASFDNAGLNFATELARIIRDRRGDAQPGAGRLFGSGEALYFDASGTHVSYKAG
jgi:hypothetical protein